jgi:hypothetical protein
MKIRLCNLQDKVEYGQFSGCQFVDVFKYSADYLDWMIKSTDDICFKNLNDFFATVQPIEIADNTLTYEQKKQIMDHLKLNNKKSSTGGFLLTLENYNYFFNNNILNHENFRSKNFKFSEEAIVKNNEKLSKLRND